MYKKSMTNGKFSILYHYLVKGQQNKVFRGQNYIFPMRFNHFMYFSKCLVADLDSATFLVGRSVGPSVLP